MMKVNQLITIIRERRRLSLGEACAAMNVGPWQIKHYANTVVDLCADIRFDGENFETIIESDPLDQKQKKVDEFVRRM
jgi:hypothetical protein